MLITAWAFQCEEPREKRKDLRLEKEAAMLPKKMIERREGGGNSIDGDIYIWRQRVWIEPLWSYNTGDEEV